MARTYKNTNPQKRNYSKNIPKQRLEKAKNEVLNKNSSIRKVAEKYHITKSTLHNFIHGKHTKDVGGQTCLTHDEEINLVKRLKTLGDWGYPITTLDLRLLIKNSLDKKGTKIKKFKNNMPGTEFCISFMRRHKNELSQRFTQNIKKCRAAISPKLIDDYFVRLEKSMGNFEIPPQNIINYDETNLTDEPGKKKAIYRRGVKYPERVINSTK